MNILLVGLGNFGARHLEAWHRLGAGDRLWVAEPDHARWEGAVGQRVPPQRRVRSVDEAIDQVDLVDIVTPTDSHAAVCRKALSAGKDVFVEKPMTMTSGEAREVAALAERTRRIVQVGYYYRFHPAAQQLKAALRVGRLGTVRYVTGNFCGFKRARTDVGVMHTDGIHFLDLFNWLLERSPVEVSAVCRDHFGRGLEDLAVALLTYPDGTVGKVEAGYIQPGRWKDKVVPGAMTTKEVIVVGERATAEVDFEAGAFVLTDVHHERRNGIWTPVIGDPVRTPSEPCDPAGLIGRELEAFLQCVRTREPSPAGPVECGVGLAQLMEGLYESAQRHEVVRLDARAAVEAP